MTTEITLPNGMRIDRESVRALERQLSEFAEHSRRHDVLAVAPEWVHRMMSAGVTDVGAFYFLFDDKRELKHEIVGNGVGLIKVRGSLARKSSYRTTYDDIVRAVKGAIGDDKVKSVLLDIDSPGGVAAGAYEAADAIAALRGKKPIWSFANDMMASAAYAIGSAADRIAGTAYSQVGSIGVVMMHVEFSKMNERVGVKPTFIFAGRKKVWGNEEEPLDPGARKEFQELVDAHYDKLVETVAANRPVLSEKAIRKTEAGVYVGESAKEADLIDAVMSYDEVIDALSGVERGGPKMSGHQNGDGQGTAAGTTTPSPTADAGQGSGAQVIDLEKEREKARTDARKEAAAAAKQIGELCTLAGRPELAAGFIAGEKSVDDVRAELLKLRADASSGEETDISTTHGRGLPGAGASLAEMMTRSLKARGMEPRQSTLSAFAVSGEGK